MMISRFSSRLLCGRVILSLLLLLPFAHSAHGQTDGAQPIAGLIQGKDGNFYGTTFFGGRYDAGVVFKITPAGKLPPLHSFSGSDGANPYANLTPGTDGNFYGTAHYGGKHGGGTVFKITQTGKLTTLYNF